MAPIGYGGMPDETYGSTMPRPRPRPNMGGWGSQPGSQNTGFPTPTTQQPTETAPTAPPTPTVPTTKVTSLMEGDPGKLNDQNHIAKSPKYQFLSLAPYYGRGQENDLLRQLQSQYGDYWNGWNFDGRGNFVYGGNPSALNAAWNGVTFVDAYGGYNDGGALKARWGAGENVLAPTTTTQETALMPGLDPMLLAGLYSPYLQQPVQAPQPAAPQTPSVLNDPKFWQSLMGMFGPQPGYSAAPAPSFAGAQYGTAAPQVNPNQQQMAQMLSQLIAGLAGGQ